MVGTRIDTPVEQGTEMPYLWLRGHCLMQPVQRVMLFVGESLA